MKKILILPLLYLLFPIQILSKEVYLGGESIGIQIQYEGLLITSTYPIQQDTINIDPKNQDIQSGDTLLEINGNTIETLQDFTTTIKQYPNQKVEITLKRNHDIIYRMLEIIHQEGNYKTGLLLKDEITGIGTLTYIDPITKNSASLGHEILDQDTQKPISLSDGTIFGSSVNQIKKAQISRVGEKQAIILFNENLGNIHKINQFGIYGKNYPIKNNLLIETALQDEIVLEKATMYTVLENQNVESIDIKITKKQIQRKPEIKSFEFEIIDQDVLEKTNGIIQGMSGSPIVQNGKLIGAVTHVSSKSPKKGYALYIEWMLNESD